MLPGQSQWGGMREGSLWGSRGAREAGRGCPGVGDGPVSWELGSLRTDSGPQGNGVKMEPALETRIFGSKGKERAVSRDRKQMGRNVYTEFRTEEMRISAGWENNLRFPGSLPASPSLTLD